VGVKGLAQDANVEGQQRGLCVMLPAKNTTTVTEGTQDISLIDAKAERQRLEKAELMMLMHSIQWWSMPLLQKLWLDNMLAYGPEGAALQGKHLWLITTTGGSEASYHPQNYNRYFFNAFMPPYEQTAALCGMRFLPPVDPAWRAPRQRTSGGVARGNLLPTLGQLTGLAGVGGS